MSDKITSIWDRPEYSPYKAAFQSRAAVFAEREAYYNGDVYKPITVDNYKQDNGVAALLSARLAAPVGQINSLIRGLFQPLSETVKIDVGLVGGDWLLIPGQEDRQKDLDDFLSGTGDLYIHYASMMGNGTLMIIDNRQSNPPTVKMIAIRPDIILPIYGGGRAGDRQLVMAIMIEMVTNAEGEHDEQAVIITENTIQTFLNGEAAILYGDKAEYPNLLGFVPIVDQQFIDVGDPIGENTYLHTMKQLDEINTMASQLNDNIRKNSNPQWAVMSDDEMPDQPIGRSDDQLWLLSAGSAVEAIIAQIDISAIMLFIDKVYSELEKKLPQYLLYKLVGLQRIAVAGIKIQLMPLTIHVLRTRRSMDRGMQSALALAYKAAISIGQEAVYSWMDGIKINGNRRIIPFDELTVLEIEAKQLAVATQKQILEAQRALASGEGVTNA